MTIAEFWNNFLTHTNKSSDTKCFESFYFALTKEAANELLQLVLAGKKRATASSAYAFKEGEMPTPGAYSIVTDFYGEPHCVIQTTAVTIMPFKDITYDICKREGEDDNLKSWQEGHTRFFTQEGKQLGYEFTQDMPVLFEDFKVVYTK